MKNVIVGLTEQGLVNLKELNRLVGEGADYKAVLKKKADVLEDIATVNAEIKENAYEQLLAEDDPIKILVEKMTFSKIGLKENLDKAKIVESYETNISETLFSLDTIGKLDRSLISPCLFRRVDLLGVKLYDKVVFDLELAIGENAAYEIVTKGDETDKQMFNLPKTATSLTTLRKELQKDVDDILFIPSEKDKTLNALKVQTSDVKYLVATLFKHGNKIKTISMPRYATVLGRILEVVNKLYTGTNYTAV